MATAPPKRPFWQLWKLPETFSQGEKRLFQLCSAGALLVLSWCSVCSLQKEYKSPIPKGFRVQTFAVTAAPPKRPFLQLWRLPKAISRGETRFPPSCSFQWAHRSSRLRGFRVRTFAVTAAPPKRPFWQLWTLPKSFSRGKTCFSPSCSPPEAHRSSRLGGFRVRTFAATAAPPKGPFWQLWKLPKSFSRGETCFSLTGSFKTVHGIADAKI